MLMFFMSLSIWAPLFSASSFGYMLLLPHDAAVVFVAAVVVIVHGFAVRYRILRLLLDYYFE